MDIIKRADGICIKVYSLLRLTILPIEKIDEIVPKKGRMVDYGSGFGITSCYLALSSKKRSMVGIEYSKKRVKKAKVISAGIKNLRFRVGDVSKINGLNADAHLLIDILHHMAYGSQIRLLNGIIKKMRKNDLVIIKEIGKRPFLKYLWNYLHDKLMTLDEGLYFRGQKWFQNFLESRGLKTQTVRCENMLYPHFLLIARR